MSATIRPEVQSVNDPTLFVAFELSAKHWKLAMTSGFNVTPWLRTVASGNLSAVARAVSQAKTRFGLSASAPVVSCYEAGRDGFWIHRALATMGIANRVVDSASIEVNRRARRAKPDRIDALKLVRMLARVCGGEGGVWREVRVPTMAEEAARHVSREREALTRERTRLINQMRGWLATWGCHLPKRCAHEWWTTVQDWAGTPLLPQVQARLARAWRRLSGLEAQLTELTAHQQAAAASAPDTSALRRLVRVKGVGATSAAILLNEGLVWREFQNRRQLGGFLGFAPTPYQSGDQRHEQGISRAGNARLQAVSVELAWQWIRWQPDSPLTRWYRLRFDHTPRLRRVGIVAVARRLMIALWRYVTTGVPPANAILKSA